MDHDPAIIEPCLSIAVMDRDTSPNVASGLLIDDDLLEDIIYRVSALLTRAFAAAKTPRSKL